ncbi:MAG: hypothetical protein Unbinned1446contig1005_1 [Prokaryotic dsDNA virus sp.]|nr:MAG: hypothetical protein Unbinned1446contig1005_1 [Prokaryotic dsDNA virus sp.]|tara:strand:+ start:2745 stop:3314 length:570 start_codon:yes stop_codon:yes gene_type:complete
MATLYISADRLKRDTPLGSSVDENILHPQITIAQDRHILPALGTQLDKKLKELIVSGISDAGNAKYKTLLDDFICPALTQFAFVEVCYVLRLRFSNNSITVPDSEQGASASIADLKLVLERAQDIAMFYRQRLIDFLCDNVEDYPEYKTNTGSDLDPTTRNYFQNMNVYERKVPNNQQIAFLEAINYKG